MNPGVLIIELRDISMLQQCIGSSAGHVALTFVYDDRLALCCTGSIQE